MSSPTLLEVLLLDRLDRGIQASFAHIRPRVGLRRPVAALVITAVEWLSRYAKNGTFAEVTYGVARTSSNSALVALITAAAKVAMVEGMDIVEEKLEAIRADDTSTRAKAIRLLAFFLRSTSFLFPLFSFFSSELPATLELAVTRSRLVRSGGGGGSTETESLPSSLPAIFGRTVGGMVLLFSAVVKGMDWYIQKGKELEPRRPIPPPPPLPPLLPAREEERQRHGCQQCAREAVAVNKQGHPLCVRCERRVRDGSARKLFLT
mmetsp:Transcript_43417/g.112983  ORF Transcript_43417/g.112983 Transcript_43417/m.112983 type:complete len:263 (-) Transcript_43417:144-932(-)